MIQWAKHKQGVSRSAEVGATMQRMALCFLRFNSLPPHPPSPSCPEPLPRQLHLCLARRSVRASPGDAGFIACFPFSEGLGNIRAFGFTQLKQLTAVDINRV